MTGFLIVMRDHEPLPSTWVQPAIDHFRRRHDDSHRVTRSAARWTVAIFLLARHCASLKNDVAMNLYRMLDRLAGVALGLLAAAAVGGATPPGAAMVPAMAVGMVLGMVTAMGGAFLLVPWLGMFEVMISGMWVGMLAGMAGAMARVMGLPWSAALAAGGVAGLVVVVAFQRLDARLTRLEGRQ
jgi:hypothetical protein